ncbi:MAG: hypothetical protein ACFE9A_21070 [Candidatus Hodarchaeota archaeon]
MSPCVLIHQLANMALWFSYLAARALCIACASAGVFEINYVQIVDGEWFSHKLIFGFRPLSCILRHRRNLTLCTSFRQMIEL